MNRIRYFCFSLAMTLASLEVSAAGDLYQIDSARSVASFSVHQFLGLTKGKFSQCGGTIEIDRAHPERSSVSAHIQAKSIDTGIRKRDEHLRSPEFFDADKYPEITFQSRSVARTGSQAGDILGDLTMHGVTRPITLHVRLLTPLDQAESGGPTRWSVTTEPLKRRDFHLLFSRSAETLSGIGQEVAIQLEIEARRK